MHAIINSGKRPKDFVDVAFLSYQDDGLSRQGVLNCTNEECIEKDKKKRRVLNPPLFYASNGLLFSFLIYGISST